MGHVAPGGLALHVHGIAIDDVARPIFIGQRHTSGCMIPRTTPHVPLLTPHTPKRIQTARARVW